MTQEPALLSSSIRDNISYGRVNATSHQIEEAAKVARLHAFISSLDKGYDTEVLDLVYLKSRGQFNLMALKDLLFIIIIFYYVSGGKSWFIIESRTESQTFCC